MPDPLRDVPQEAVDLIKSFEGIPDGDPSTVNIDAYLCPANVWTIGWGHAIMDGGVQLKGAAHKARARALFPGGITRNQAEALLRGDLVPRAASVSRLLKVAVNDGQFGALISLVFNVGLGNFGASTLLRKLNAGDMAGAADQFLAWDKARVNGVLKALAGLTRRRKAERAMFLGQDWRAVSATRSGGPLTVLPVPEMPAEDQAWLKAAARKVTAKKAAKTAVPKKAAPRKTTAKKSAVKKTPVKRSAVKKPTAARKAASGK
ncbi:MAG: glycoside hydrolase family protein [Rubrivivax sp.]|nr:glycoside hydrolase family protein [Rubrivivax sp.]MDP3224734.1 glycoside hydrolase family protein [Rubrivivax sp.]MDP3616142.1 glycoside hydrolase family protein [Rubrivivax sp.]